LRAIVDSAFFLKNNYLIISGKRYIAYDGRSKWIMDAIKAIRDVIDKLLKKMQDDVEKDNNTLYKLHVKQSFLAIDLLAKLLKEMR